MPIADEFRRQKLDYFFDSAIFPRLDRSDKLIDIGNPQLAGHQRRVGLRCPVNLQSLGAKRAHKSANYLATRLVHRLAEKHVSRGCVGQSCISIGSQQLSHRIKHCRLPDTVPICLRQQRSGQRCAKTLSRDTRCDIGPSNVCHVSRQLSRSVADHMP